MKRVKKSLAILTAFSVTVTSMYGLGSINVAKAAGETTITYNFTGDEKNQAGYAEGTITVSSDKAGTYHLYWADDNKALEGYYEINSKLREKLTGILGGKKFEGTGFITNAGGSSSFTFGKHTAIPAGATKIIAVTDSNKTNVSDAVAVYDIPENKQLSAGSGELLYKFNTVSDVHIDKRTYEAVYYEKSEPRFKAALEYASKKGAEFIASSGDMVTNAKDTSEMDREWATYQEILSNSSFTGNIWESNGNHDLKAGVEAGHKAFIRSGGTDSTTANFAANKPYYFMVEPNSGDVFIFMALETHSSPNKEENEFSQAQIDWLKDLLDTYYGTGVNIYITEHSAFKKFGSGDDWSAKGNTGYYGGHMEGNSGTNKQFKNILKKYKGVIFMNGHSHQDFCISTNYSNENGNACHMIHNPATVGTTYPYNSSAADKITDGTQKYVSPENPEESGSKGRGQGYNSQCYYVETYENEVIYYGSDVEAHKIYPEYCYIMEGARHLESIATNETRKIIQPTYEFFKLNKEIISENASLSDAITVAKNLLGDSDYKKYCSYDQYALVKRLVAMYSNNALLVDETVAAKKLKQACEDLYGVVAKIKGSGDVSVTVIRGDTGRTSTGQGGSGGDSSVTVLSTYYFENNKNWSKVYCYAWNGSTDKNAEWPGVELSSVGKSSSGNDVYEMKFTTAGQYGKIIFSNGNGSQTVDITLSEYSSNCFSIGSSAGSSGGTTKYEVNNYAYGAESQSGSQPTAAPEDNTVVSKSSRYGFIYYSTSHTNWDDVAGYFEELSNGTYRYTYSAVDANDISMKIYDKNDSSKPYYVVYGDAGAKGSYAAGSTDNFSLTKNSSRSGNQVHSVSISGVPAGATVTFIFNPSTGALQVTYGN